jgi:polyisoprenyl-teichoic acid--peptidoglycan teichoic acid transferase
MQIFIKIIVSCVTLILAIGAFAYFGGFNLENLFKPVSIVSKVLTEDGPKETDGKTNFLLLGIDSRSAGSSVGSSLTDTLIILSVDKKTGKAAMVSLPRDLWVDQYKNKINAVYALSGKNIEKTVKEVENISGMPIHYYAIVGFDVFKDIVDSIGGVEIDVENAFEDFLYPIEGKEKVLPESARYEHLVFKSGVQNMNGETALKYARSRHSTNALEAGDFARARRQQKVILAIKQKVLSSSTLLDPSKVNKMFEAVKSNLQTNIDTADVLILYKAFANFKYDDIKRIVVSNEIGKEGENYIGAGVLTVPNEENRKAFYGGLYVLVPASGSFSELHAIIRQAVFE